MNTHSNFFKPNGTKLPMGKDMRLLTNDNQPRVKTSGSPPNRMPFIKEYGQVGAYPGVYNATTRPLPGSNFMSNYNIQNLNVMDSDKLKEELIKYKNDLNKKTKEHHSLKIAYLKLDAENKKNIKIIEEVLQEASKQRGEEEETDWKNLIASTNINMNTVNKLKEAHIVNSLRRQVQEYKSLLNVKEEELSMLKNSSKVAKFHELDSKFKSTMEEMSNLMERFSIVRANLNDKEIKLKETTDERDYYKAMMMRIKTQYDESKEKLQYYSDQNTKLGDQLKQMEDKQAQGRFQQNSLKSQIREKDLAIASLEEKIRYNDSFPNEREKMEKSIAYLNKNLQSTKDDNEKKTRRLKELEKNNQELKEKIDNLNNDIKKLGTGSQGPQTTHKEKDKKIKKLEDELAPIREEKNKLKDELEKIKNENTRLNTDIEKKLKELSQLQTENKNLQDKYQELQISYEELQNILNNLKNKITEDSHAKKTERVEKVEKVEKSEKKKDTHKKLQDVEKPKNIEDENPYIKPKSKEILQDKNITIEKEEHQEKPHQNIESHHNNQPEESVVNQLEEQTEPQPHQPAEEEHTLIDHHTEDPHQEAEVKVQQNQELQQEEENYDNNFDKEEYNAHEENEEGVVEQVDPSDLL